MLIANGGELPWLMAESSIDRILDDAVGQTAS